MTYIVFDLETRCLLGFEVTVAVCPMMVVFWVVLSCSLVDVHRRPEDSRVHGII